MPYQHYYGQSWMDPYVLYLKEGILPEQKKEAEIIRRKAMRFWLSKDSKLYKRSFSGPYLLCVHPNIVEDLLYEIHKGIYGSHPGILVALHAEGRCSLRKKVRQMSEVLTFGASTNW